MIKVLNAAIRFLRTSVPKSILKHIPEPVFLLYHRLINMIAVIQYGHPSRKLIVVGVTGTNGKTTTTLLIRDILKSASIKTGLLGTTEIAIGNEVVPNDMHTTMLGRGFIHMQLKRMVDAGCKIAIVETTSEGIKQYRHEGVEYDIVVFTNLTPEHLQSHDGSFEKYKQAKMSIFKNLHKRFRKDIPKVILANADDEHGKNFLRHTADKNISFGMDSGDVRAEDVTVSNTIAFSLRNESARETYEVPLPGKFNVYNALAAVLVTKELGLSHTQIAEGLKKISGIPGRMELIDEGQDFRVFLDFAHEGVGIRNAFGALQEFRKGGHKVIGLVGGIGGGRDRRNRFEIGKAAAELADMLIVTTQDPYDDNPAEIIADIVSTAKKGGLMPNETLFTEIDRRNGIHKALSLAKADDTVIIAGKGVELTIIMKGETIPWDEREIVREEIRKFTPKRH